jgi:hypothetical protein
MSIKLKQISLVDGRNASGERRHGAVDGERAVLERDHDREAPGGAAARVAAAAVPSAAAARHVRASLLTPSERLVTRLGLCPNMYLHFSSF